MNFKKFLEIINSGEIQPCIGCGFCCLRTRCEESWIEHKTNSNLCPSLKWNGSRHECELMLRLEGEGDKFKLKLHEGAGCVSGLNPWRHKPLRDRTKGTIYNSDCTCGVTPIQIKD